jgi:hypothetical protein
MKALVYNGPRDVALSEVADPGIVRPCDAVVQITRTNMCGSDLHMYEGRTDMEPGRVLGHENMGRVVPGDAAEAQPSFLVSHQLPLAHVPEGYRYFDARDIGWTQSRPHPSRLTRPVPGPQDAAPAGGRAGGWLPDGVVNLDHVRQAAGSCHRHGPWRWSPCRWAGSSSP